MHAERQKNPKPYKTLIGLSVGGSGVRGRWLNSHLLVHFGLTAQAMQRIMKDAFGILTVGFTGTALQVF